MFSKEVIDLGKKIESDIAGYPSSQCFSRLDAEPIPFLCNLYSFYRTTFGLFGTGVNPQASDFSGAIAVPRKR
jgi:hypothetical protein